MLALRMMRPVVQRCTSVRRMATPVFTRSMSTRYSKSHEWVSLDGDVATVGITDHAQDLLGDLVYVELPEAGDEFDAGESFASVESVKAASDVYAPVGGTVVEVNEDLEGEPAIVNQAAETDGWLAKLTIADEGELDNLLTREEYDAFVQEEEDH